MEKTKYQKEIEIAVMSAGYAIVMTENVDDDLYEITAQKLENGEWLNFTIDNETGELSNFIFTNKEMKPLEENKLLIEQLTLQIKTKNESEKK